MSTDMLQRLTNCRFLIIIIIISVSCHTDFRTIEHSDYRHTILSQTLLEGACSIPQTLAGFRGSTKGKRREEWRGGERKGGEGERKGVSPGPVTK